MIIGIQPPWSNIWLYKVLGHDALRMRLRRLVEVKPNGKCHVDQTTREDYQNPERREWLEMALLQAIKKFGTSRTVFTKIRVGVFQNIMCSIWHAFYNHIFLFSDKSFG